MSRTHICTLCTLCTLLWTGMGIAEAAPLTYRYKHFLFPINSAQHPEWKSATEVWTWEGREIAPDPSWRVDGDAIPPLPPGVRRSLQWTWNRAAIRATIDRVAGKALVRNPGDVTITRDEKGNIRFSGVGLTGRAVDLDTAADLTIGALQAGVTEIELPVRETQPQLQVEDPQLRAMGITEVVTIGESDFSRSPVNRRHNIGVGLARFNGTLIPAGSTFSFNAVLGRVDQTTGYKMELVIKGDRTEPDYGGGLCQISTTAYRGIWEYGFPIVRRRNHSYTVRYYAPPGTDATVYPGAADMVFMNDLPHALLIQTHRENDMAYFIYYGTRDRRVTDLLGPFVTGKKDPPPDKIELTTDLPPGEKKKLNERVPGLTAVWYRYLQPETGSGSREKVVSIYEARPLFTAVGVLELPPGYAPGGSGSVLLYTEDAVPDR